jgi:hypothetical protein
MGEFVEVLVLERGHVPHLILSASEEVEIEPPRKTPRMNLGYDSSKSTEPEAYGMALGNGTRTAIPRSEEA